MAKHLKERTGEAETREYDANIRHTVEDILADIEDRGDAGGARIVGEIRFMVARQLPAVGCRHRRTGRQRRAGDH